MENSLKEDWLNIDQLKALFQKAPVKEFPNNVIKEVPEPKVTVRITTYQHANYIVKTLESILMQEASFPFEIIIGDDDSIDGTRETCIYYAKKYPDKIRLFLHSRRNNISVLGKPTGIFQICYNTLKSRGKYIVGCSGDDYWQDPKKLQKQFDFLEQNPEISFTYHDHLRFYVNDDKVKGPFSAERIQTAMGRNVFNKLPTEFLHIMQEDTFFSFFWKHYGNSQYIDTVKPNVIRFHSKSMYSSLPKEEIYQHKINLWSNIVNACGKNKELVEKANNFFCKTIFYHYRNQKSDPLYFSIPKLVFDIQRYSLTVSFIKLIPKIVFNKLKKNYC